MTQPTDVRRNEQRNRLPIDANLNRIYEEDTQNG